MAEIVGKYMEDEKVKFIKRHVPTKVSRTLPDPTLFARLLSLLW